MIALPTPQFIAMVRGILATSAPIPPDAIAAWIKRAATTTDPDIAATMDQVLEGAVFKTVLAHCLSAVAVKHGGGRQTSERVFAALMAGEPFPDLAPELGVDDAMLRADFEAAYTDATGEVIAPAVTVH